MQARQNAEQTIVDSALKPGFGTDPWNFLATNIHFSDWDWERCPMFFTTVFTPRSLFL